MGVVGFCSTAPAKGEVTEKDKEKVMNSRWNSSARKLQVGKRELGKHM